MIFGNKYDIADMKALFEKADKNFNPSKFNLNDKEPDRQTFKSKLFYKFISMNNKSLSKAKKGTNAKYFDLISETNGDYSRRKGVVNEQCKNMVDDIKKLIKDNPDLEYSVCGVFVNTYDALSNLGWRSAFKQSFDYTKKAGDGKTLASAFKALYMSMVFACESMMLKMVDVEFSIANGINPIDAVRSAHYDDREFMDKLVLPAINLCALMKGTKDPAKLIRNFINGERNAAKSRESFEEEHDPNVVSTEGAFLKAMQESANLVLSMCALGISAVIAVAGLFVPGAQGGAIAIIGAVSAGIILLVTLVPSIRIIIYYGSIVKVDMIKELELNSELLTNNIMILKEKYDQMGDGPEKEKLKEVIAKQEALYEKLQIKRSKLYSDVYGVENDLSSDETESDKEVDSSYDDTNEEGDPVGDGGFNIEI